MNPNTVVEIIGYVGSALVVISMLMTSVVRLRVINLIGSLIFTCYALLIRSYPTAAMNLFLVGINVYHLVRLLKVQKSYDLVAVDGDSSYVAYLLEKYGEDIRSFFPSFSFNRDEVDTAWLVCCDSSPAGLFLGKCSGEGTVDVLLDYSTPVYRDTSVGRFLYSRLAKEGFRSLVFRENAPRHVDYMEKVGYKKSENGAYILTLSA